MTAPHPSTHSARALQLLNTRWHEAASYTFLVIVLAHWAEHVTQAVQVYALGWDMAHAGGVLGYFFPWLVHSEVLHYGYAVIMLLGFWALRPGFVGRARPWWTAALWIQVWHHFEHLLLFLQAMTGRMLFDPSGPTSIGQLVVRRLELHLLYNTAVFVPMVVAMLYHLFPSQGEAATMRCSCGLRRSTAQA